MNKNLPIYGVPTKLKEFATSKKDIKAGTERLPPDSYILASENLFDPLTYQTKSVSDTRLDVSQEDEIPQGMTHRPTYVK